MTDAVLLWLCVICPPTVLYWPLNVTPGVAWTEIVRDIDVMAAVLVILTPSSLKKGLFELMIVFTVTPPLPLTIGFTVRTIVVVRVSVPLVPVTVTVALPVVAVFDAVKDRTLLPVVGFGLNACWSLPILLA